MLISILVPSIDPLWVPDLKWFTLAATRSSDHMTLFMFGAKSIIMPDGMWQILENKLGTFGGELADPSSKT